MESSLYSWSVARARDGLEYRFKMLGTAASINVGLKPAEAFVEAAAVWCLEQFGPPDGIRWAIPGWSIEFSSPIDATAFRLRWC
ncbi:MAG: hypothetical protein EOO77_27730 [Oxalobacteraceae bacterium]|nr:MAG: hypothetical protein EOO77_27730 [Oxalobacteraceae bacterium]